MKNKFHSKVAGVNFKNENGELRQDLIRDSVSAGDQLSLEREPYNEHDANAIAVFSELYEQIGYLNSTVAAELAPLMEAGQVVTCQVTEVTGNEDLEQSYGVNILLTVLSAAESELWKAEHPVPAPVVRAPAPIMPAPARETPFLARKPIKQKVVDPNRSPRSIVVLLILWAFLGYIGGHRWYAGRGSLLYTITIGYLMIGWIVDLFVILSGKFEDNHGRQFRF